MRTVTIVPIGKNAQSIDVNVFNDAGVLQAADQHALYDAAIFEDGAYRYSLRREGGVWCIYDRTAPP